MVATKALQIPQRGSSGVGRALQSCPKMKQRMRRPSLCTVAFSEGCHWGEGLRSRQPRAVLGRDSLGAHQQATPLAAGEKSAWSWMGTLRANHHIHYHTVIVEFNELFSKTVLLMILLILTDFIVFHLRVHTDMSILFTKRYSMGFL